MKKTMLIILSAVIAFEVGVLTTANWAEVHYTRHDCTVVSYVEDVVVVEDKTGNEWEIIAEGLEIGDKVDLEMHTNFTDNCIYDDIVEGYKVK